MNGVGFVVCILSSIDVQISSTLPQTIHSGIFLWQF